MEVKLNGMSIDDFLDVLTRLKDTYRNFGQRILDNLILETEFRFTDIEQMIRDDESPKTVVSLKYRNDIENTEQLISNTHTDGDSIFVDDVPLDYENKYVLLSNGKIGLRRIPHTVDFRMAYISGFTYYEKDGKDWKVREFVEGHNYLVASFILAAEGFIRDVLNLIYNENL